MTFFNLIWTYLALSRHVSLVNAGEAPEQRKGTPLPRPLNPRLGGTADGVRREEAPTPYPPGTPMFPRYYAATYIRDKSRAGR